MRTGAVLVLALALTAPLAACGPKASSTPTATAPLVEPAAPAAPAPAAAEDFDALMREVMAYMGKLADGVEAAGADCAVMATSIETVTSGHKDLIARTKQLDEDEASSAKSEQWMQAHEAEIKPVFERLFGGLQKCQGDPAVQAAMEKMTAS